MSAPHDTFLNWAENVLFVRGAHQGAIYDLRRKRITSVDHAGCLVLDALAEGSTDDALGTVGRQELDEVVSFLTQASLATIDSERLDRNSSLESEQSPDPGFEVGWIELGTNCNHTCGHCYNFSAKQPQRGLDVEAIRNTIYQLKEVGTRTIKFIGGEPLLYMQELTALIPVAVGLRFDAVAIHTNGSLLDRNFANFCQRHGVQFDVTLYGHTADIHEAVTRTSGSFASTTAAIDLAVEANANVSLNLIVTPAVESVLDEALEGLRNRFPGLRLEYDYLRPSGRGVAMYKQLLMTGLNRHQEHRSFFEGIDRDEYLLRRDYHPCLATKISVTSDGQVMPCIMTRDVAGSLTTSSLRAVVASEAFTRYRQLPLSRVDVCRDCEFRFACTDCRPIAIGLGKGPLGKPPECTYNPYTGELETAARG